MPDAKTVTKFLRTHRASLVGASPARPEALGPDDAEAAAPNYSFDAERHPEEWKPVPTGGEAAGLCEHPVRFIDGSHLGQPVACLRSPQGHPVPLLLAQVGAIVLRLDGREFVRERYEIRQVLGMVADAFSPEEAKEFEAAFASHPVLPLQVLFARMARDKSPFDYEVMRTQAYIRCQHEMLKLEIAALRAAPELPTLVDGQLGGRIGEKEATTMPLLVGLVKAPTPAPLPDRAWNALLDLKPGERTPYFKDVRQTANKVTETPLACWYLRLAGGARLAPNWGVVRVDVPWVQMERHAEGAARTNFANRLSQWLVRARCTAESYARMPISLEPIVRAEAALKPLFAPLDVLVNRFYHQTGLAGGG
jgi:hypothetical protein